MKAEIAEHISAELIDLLAETTLGTNGAKYRHLDIRSRILKADNPISLSLKRNDRIIANITFCKRDFAFYLRYFAFDKRFQSGGKTKSKTKNNSFIKKEIERLFQSLEAEHLTGEKLCYAYIDPKNERSKWMSETFGFEKKATLVTQAFSRFYPKKSSELVEIKDFDEIKTIVHSNYANHQFYFEYHSSQAPFLALKNSKGEIEALGNFTVVEWEIGRLPGKFGGITTKLLPYLPFLNRIINPKLHRFLVPEIVCNPSADPHKIEQLFESALAHHNVHSLLWWMDENDSIYTNCKEKINWGVLNKLLGVSPVDVMVRGKVDAFQKPIFVTGFDMV